MNRIRKNVGRPFALLLTLCITFLLIAVVAPSERITSPNTPVISNIDSVTDVQTSAQKVGKTYFLTTFSGNEIVSEIEINLLTDRSYRDFRGFAFRFNKLLLPIISLGVLVLCFGYVINKKEQNKSVLAIRLGGHAPPQGQLFQYA